jgi:hypothetical protein
MADRQRNSSTVIIEKTKANTSKGQKRGLAHRSYTARGGKERCCHLAKLPEGIQIASMPPASIFLLKTFRTS